MKDALSTTPFPSLELNMSRLSPCPNKIGTKASKQSCAIEQDRASSINIRRAFQNDINNDESPSSIETIVNNHGTNGHTLPNEDGQSMDSTSITSRQEVTNERDHGSVVKEKGGCHTSKFQDTETAKDSVIESEFDIIIAEAVQMIGEAETYLEEMRMIQVKNAILMDSLVMIEG